MNVVDIYGFHVRKKSEFVQNVKVLIGIKREKEKAGLIKMNKIRPDMSIKCWDKENRKLIRRKTGVYVIYLGKDCLYLGASRNLASRLTRIINKNPIDNTLLRIILENFDKTYPHLKLRTDLYFCSVQKLRIIEQEYINKFEPKLNESNKFYRKSWLLAKNINFQRPKPQSKFGPMVKCLECGKEFHISPCWIGKRGKFHNRKCYFNYLNKVLYPKNPIDKK